MSILIKGMELPKDIEIFLRIDEKGEVYVYGSYPTELHKAVPVPPHGRLIDGDVADVIPFTADDAEERDFYDGILYAADWISKQPTIIEAEEAET